jgi:tetratricopeptide (TPR) repeat protein
MAALMAAATILAGGCGEETPRPATNAAQQQRMDVRAREDTFRYAASLLNSPDTLNVDPTIKERQSITQSAVRLIYGNTPAAVIEQLNRRLMTQKPAADWKPDPLVAGLPEAVRELKSVENLGDMRFATIDGAALREAVWLRSISNLACSDAISALDRAQRLFDWTVRNIQLDPAPSEEEPEAALPCLAWHLLLLGHGQAEDRAWLFMLLARQQGMDVVLLKPAARKPVTLVGLLDASEQDGAQLYLFDMRLGLPIPGPGGKGVATLAQAAKDDSLLRQLDLDAEHAYPLFSSDVSQLTAEIEGSPLYLQQRAAVVEAKLSGDQKLELSTDPSALAKRLKTLPQIEQAELWPLPLERLLSLADRKSPQVLRLAAQLEPFLTFYPHPKKKEIENAPLLWRGRTQHLMGNFTGPTGANHYYQAVRLPDVEIEGVAAAHGMQLNQITDPEIKKKMTQESQKALQNLRTSKQDASYWLGLIAFERGNPTTAEDYFLKRTLEPSPDGPWTPGAWYNLGRTYETLGQADQAIEAYRNDESPQRHGSLLKARRLESEAAKAEPQKAAANS